MNAKFRGFSFATRASDSDDGPLGIQALGDERTESSPKKKPSARRTADARLSTIAKAQLTTSGLLELVEPQRGAEDLIVSPENYQALSEIVDEVRRGEELQRYGLSPRSKLLFCGPV